MKIVQISHSYPPMINGAAIMVQKLAQGLAADGHEVLVLAASVPEMIEHSVHGYLAQPGDCTGLVAHINWLLQHPDKAARMGQSCRQRAAKYGLEQVIYQHEQLYSEIWWFHCCCYCRSDRNSVFVEYIARSGATRRIRSVTGLDSSNHSMAHSRFAVWVDDRNASDMAYA